MPNSARDLRSHRALRRPPVDTFQKIPELRRRDRHRIADRTRPDEAPALQPFRKQAQALAVVPEHLDQIPALTTKDEQMPAMRIAAQRLLHAQRQAIEALAHIRMAG